MNISLKLIAVLLLTVFLGCNNRLRLDNDAIVSALKSDDGVLNLPSIGPSNWERMCTLGPYSTNKVAEAKLGFAWDVQSQTEIEMRDDIYLLVFVHDNSVEAFVEMPRHKNDLLHANQSCFNFSDAKLRRDSSGQWTPLGAEG